MSNRPSYSTTTNQQTYTEPKIKQKPSPKPSQKPVQRHNAQTVQVCVVANYGNTVNVRANCDTADCDGDESTIISSLQSETYVNLLDIPDVPSANGFKWLPISSFDNKVLWIASTKLLCE